MTCGRRVKYPVICCQKNNKYLRTYRHNWKRSCREEEADITRHLERGVTINFSTTTSKIDGSNITTTHFDTSEAPIVITGISTRTRAASCAAFNSTTPTSNETQRKTVVTGGAQRYAPQVTQSVSPQVND